MSSNPTSNANRTSREAYDRRIKENEKVCVYILASMSDVLAKKHESLATVKEIMDSLKGMFGQPEWSLRRETIKYIYTKRMKKGTSVREHVLDMMMHFNIAEVNGGVIDEANQNLTMGKGKEVEANVATTKRKFSRRSFSKSKAGPSKPNRKIEKKKKGKTPKPNNVKKTTKKGKCYHRGENGHWFRNCPKHLAHKIAKKEAQGKTTKTLRSDRDREYIDLQFQDYLIEHGIQSQLSTPSTPQQNSVPEKRNRTLLDMVRFMMSFAQLPDSFLGYALETVIYILNNVPSKSVSGTPYELWKGRKGYPKESKDGLFYDPQENKVFVSTNATFLEEEHIRNHQTRSKLVLEEISKNTTDRPSSSTKLVDKTRNIGQTHPSQKFREPRRSGRVVRQPDRYLGLSEAQIVIPDDGIEDPLTYKQAMNDMDCDQWIKAMDLEMESMYSNSVWTLVDQPNNVKPIGCKWIYKRKRDQAGKVQTFKARLMAKGYTQKEGIYYEETFSLVAMLKSIRILLSIATFYDYEIWQMDVKTAYFNRNLEESIYMVQL
ncbi:gag/pol protein [Cucumis melo var. makuwa]|uniref:Gag/pol protein n=1 Tax=Cucumis melo var. makuwa TaxID=1194695 RepID=A0A5D3BEB1_CUCMM|nr:gag/pol protein [Cucumis melo var. makuwa]